MMILERNASEMTFGESRADTINRKVVANMIHGHFQSTVGPWAINVQVYLVFAYLLVITKLDSGNIIKGSISSVRQYKNSYRY